MARAQKIMRLVINADCDEGVAHAQEWLDALGTAVLRDPYTDLPGEPDVTLEPVGEWWKDSEVIDEG